MNDSRYVSDFDVTWCLAPSWMGCVLTMPYEVGGKAHGQRLSGARPDEKVFSTICLQSPSPCTSLLDSSGPESRPAPVAVDHRDRQHALIHSRVIGWHLDHIVPRLLGQSGSTARAAGWVGVQSGRLDLQWVRCSSGGPALDLHSKVLGSPRHKGNDLLAKPPKVHTESPDDRRPHSLTFSDQPQENVLGTDVAVTELQCLTKSKFKHLLRPQGEWW